MVGALFFLSSCFTCLTSRTQWASLCFYHHFLAACLYPITIPQNGSCSENSLSDAAVFVITSATRCASAANGQHPASTIKLAQDKSEYDPRQSSQETLSKIKWFNFCDCLTYIQSQLSSLEHKHFVCQLPWAQTQLKSTILQHALDSVQFRCRICSDRGDYPVLWANPFALLVTVNCKVDFWVLHSWDHVECAQFQT